MNADDEIKIYDLDKMPVKRWNTDGELILTWRKKGVENF